MNTPSDHEQPGHAPGLLAAPGGGPHDIADLTAYVAGLASLSIPAFLNVIAGWLEPRWIVPDTADQVQTMIEAAVRRLDPEAVNDLSIAARRWIIASEPRSPSIPRGANGRAGHGLSG